MKNTFLAILTVVMLCGGCSPYRTTSGDEIPVIDVRSAIQNESHFSMKDDVKSIEYIPLETTDECLISNIIDLKGHVDLEDETLEGLDYAIISIH